MDSKETIKMLADLFEVKIPNPVVDFFFCGKEVFKNGEANLPSDFEEYKLIGEKSDPECPSIIWQCYGKQAIRGCFSKDYWRK